MVHNASTARTTRTKVEAPVMMSRVWCGGRAADDAVVLLRDEQRHENVAVPSVCVCEVRVGVDG
jgi:hypothetical protein